MKLNQIIAIEKGVKSRATAELTEMHKASQKSELFTGFSKTYSPKDEQGEKYPPEQKKVQLQAKSLLRKTSLLMSELWDVTASKDWGNQTAVADLAINGTVLVENVPVTYLLFLEKQLTDIHTFIEKMPVLDENEDWALDSNSGLFKTQPVSTHRTKKLQTPIVKYPATPEHPAQTEMITEDVLVGYWETIKQSGGLSRPTKDLLLGNLDDVRKAVKFAREEANGVEITKMEVGKKIFDFFLTL